jgi:peptidoglycan/LPS O-acetylase OafA/YrhL
MPAESTGDKRSWARLDGVDILRGLAIFFVLMNHVNMRLLIAKVPYTHGLPPLLVQSLVWNGQFGVQIFFAISGFLITSIALRRWGSLSRVNVRDFYLLRFGRIAPLLLALLAVLSALHFAHLKDFVIPPQKGGLRPALFSALTFHLNLSEAQHGYLPGAWDVLWSLSVEEMFYLFFPLLARLLGRGKLFVVLLLIFVALGPFGRTVLTYGNPIWREKSYLGGMDAIALGCLTALLASRIRFSHSVLRSSTAIGIALLVLILGFGSMPFLHGLDRQGLEETILAIGTCLVIIAAAQTRWKSPRVFAPLLKLGQRSYEVYLTHMFVVFAFFDLFVKMDKPMWAVPGLFIVTIVVSALLGDLVANLYSEPINRFLRTRSGERRLGSALARFNVEDSSSAGLTSSTSSSSARVHLDR